MSDRVTLSVLLEKKRAKEKIVALTAYDYSTAVLLDEGGVDLLLVGDSLGMVVLGYENTLPVTMEEMLHHTAAVSRGAKRALVVGDMPFLSYQAGGERALLNAGRFLKEAGAQAVKLEGGSELSAAVKQIVQAGIPVMGHLGLTPQHVHAMSGYRVQGRGDPEAAKIKADAHSLQEAGAFSLVLECVPASLAGEISRELNIPVIGIGAGAECDGQILVTHDLLGLYGKMQPRFAKRYAELAPIVKGAVDGFSEEVRKGAFPGPEHSF